MMTTKVDSDGVETELSPSIKPSDGEEHIFINEEVCLLINMFFYIQISLRFLKGWMYLKP